MEGREYTREPTLGNARQNLCFRAPSASGLPADTLPFSMPVTGVRTQRSPSPPPPVHRAAGALEGRVIGDRYRLLSPIAEGLASAVFKAEHVRMGKALCIKVLRGPLARDPELAARFRTEAKVVSRLSHPHTIGVFDFGELEGNEGFYLAMEYLHGENLFDVLRREGRLPWTRAAAIGEQLLGALGEAHEAGIVHRDVKPANVMLLQPKNDADFVKLLDFGIAEIEGQGPGGGLGTPTYLSPEQARGAAPDARSDLYSLGALLYEMVGGRPPFVAPNPMAVLSAHLHEEPAPLASLCPEVSPDFALDRAGIVGADGPTHHGLYDLAYLRCLPNIVLMAPRDENELRRMLMTALYCGHPAALRYPRGNGRGVVLEEPITALPVGKGELLREGEDLLLCALGSMVEPALAMAERFALEGLSCAVINARFVKPLDAPLILEWAARCRGTVTLEEGCAPGGFGTAVAEALGDAGLLRPILRCAVPDHLVHHGDATRLLEEEGLGPAALEVRVRTFAAKLQKS